MWTRLINAFLGIWLMFAPAILKYSAPAGTNDHIFGPLITMFAVIAVWEVMRPVRMLNAISGIWLIIAPFLLGYDRPEAFLNSIASGFIITVCALIKGKIKHQYGGGWRVLWEKGK